MQTDEIKRQRAALRDFYTRLAETVAPWAPTRPTFKRGLAWSGMHAGVFNSVLIGSYAGSFSDPIRHGPAIPRVYMNYFSYPIPHTRQRAWSELHGQRCSWHQSGHRLELTVTMGELPDFASWIAAWARAAEAGDRDLLPVSPHSFEATGKAVDPFRMNYLWTAAATAEYAAREAGRRTKGASKAAGQGAA